MMYYVTLYSDMYSTDIIYTLFVYKHFHFIVQVLFIYLLLYRVVWNTRQRATLLAS